MIKIDQDERQPFTTPQKEGKGKEKKRRFSADQSMIWGIIIPFSVLSFPASTEH
jgi:hypothetical protein